MPSPLSKALEKELTCSICTGLLFDPVTYISCLHTNCGSCSKSWFLSQPTNPTCPECRKPVNDITAQAIIGSLIDVFLQHNPDQKPSEEDIRRARSVYKPGETLFINGVFVATDSSTATATSTTATATATATTTSPTTWASLLSPISSSSLTASTNHRPVIPPTPIISPTVPRSIRPTARLATPTLSSLLTSASAQPTSTHRRYHIPQRNPSISSTPTWAASQLDRAFSTPGTSQSQAHQFFLSLTLSPSPAQRSITDIISQEQVPVHITCDLCSEVLDTKLHYECSSCRLFHICLVCYRQGARCPYQNHRGRLQKQDFEHREGRQGQRDGQGRQIQIQGRQIQGLGGVRQRAGQLGTRETRETSREGTTLQPYVQTGLFCSICSAWIDEARYGTPVSSMSSYFFHCVGDGSGNNSCNNGHWYYCSTCRRRGNICSHTLYPYTNLRSHAHESTAILRGSQPSRDITGLRESEKWTGYFTICNRCERCLGDAEIWWHCIHPECCGGDYDLCVDCTSIVSNPFNPNLATSPASTPLIFGNSFLSSLCEAIFTVPMCEKNHPMLSLQSTPDGGIKLLSRPPPEDIPEICNSPNLPGRQPKKVIALAGNWPRDGTLGLMFPESAVIEEVRSAGDGLAWGTYCGMQGIFEERLVRDLSD
ncbi:hypothetical protein BZA77DRAFT_351502 [Pyronema omphalodes]|nr:hypothetical protein BZA77DRAFT_351502 [Pyronema omphalodes]